MHNFSGVALGGGYKGYLMILTFLLASHSKSEFTISLLPRQTFQGYVDGLYQKISKTYKDINISLICFVL